MQVKDLTPDARSDLMDEVFGYLEVVKKMKIPLDHSKKMLEYEIEGHNYEEDAAYISKWYIYDQEQAGWRWSDEKGAWI